MAAVDHLTPLQGQIKRVTREMRAKIPCDIAGNAYDVEDALENALSRRLRDRPWTHPEQFELRRRLKEDAYPTIKDAEDAAAIYLAQPGRSADLDRLLADMLLASEVFAYACERKDSRWFRWLGILLNAAISYGIASWLHAEIWYVLATIWLTWTVVAQMWDGLKARRLLASMLSTYHVLNGRVVSLPHLRSQVNGSTAAGVVWPATLHALLDDIEARTQRI